MSFTRYASFEAATVLEVKGAPTRQRTASLDKVSEYNNYRTGDKYLYVRIRAISSRVNKNHDGWPSVELAGSREIFDAHKQSSTGFTIEASEGNKEFGFATFIGKPIFVDHHNSDPKRARGVIVDSKLIVEPADSRTAGLDSYYSSDDVDHEHLPPTEVELLLEVDAKSFPKLAKAIKEGEIDGFSMGCDVERSKCSHCGNIATNPDEYCSHIVMKGAQHDFKTADGKRTAKKSYENCYGIKFFEISAVFDPADETALTKEVRASIEKEAENPLPQSFEDHAPTEIDTLRQESICPICGSDIEGETCDVCFLPGTLVRTESGYKSIDSIRIGDKVLGESGRFNKVLEVMKRDWEGHVKKIDGPSLTEPIYVTPNHPFKVLVGHHGSKETRCEPGRCERHSKFKDIHSLEWVHADCLTTDTYVASVVPREERDLLFINIPSIHTVPRKHGSLRRGPREFELTDEFLWALGLYIAEGSKGDRSITYSSHKNEIDYQNRITNLFQNQGYTTKLEHRDSKPNSAWVHINSSVLADWFPEWVGTGSHNKKIPEEIINLPIDKLSHVYRGILDGDGCAAANDLGQTSQALALQVHEIARKVGLGATIQREYPEGKRTVYTVNNVTDAKRSYYVPITEKTNRFPRNTWELEGYKLYRLSSVKEVKYSGPVYNLRIENDPTYTVQNLLVHNCGYVQPPKGFDNPDLDKAKKIDAEMEAGDEVTIPNEEAQSEQAQAGPNAPPKKPGSWVQDQQGQAQATKPQPTANIKSEMQWTPYVHQKVAARINQRETPLQVVQKPSSNEPSKETVTSDQIKPVTSSVTPAMLTARHLIAKAQANTTGDTMSQRNAQGPTPDAAAPDKRVDVTGVGGVLEADNVGASKADAQIDVLGVGTTGVSDVGADETETLPSSDTDNAGFDTTKNQEDSGPTKTYGDSDGTQHGTTDPVTTQTPWFATSAERRAYEQGVGDIQDGEPGSANQGVQPVDPIGKAGDRVDVLKPVTSPANNSGDTSQWTGTGGNGVLRQQDPVTKDVTKSDGITARFINAIKLADTEVEMGLIHKDRKYERIAELEKESPESLSAQINTLAKVKTASLSRQAPRTSGVTRLPSLFGKSTAESRGFDHITAGVDRQDKEPVDDSLLDSAVFSR